MRIAGAIRSSREKLLVDRLEGILPNRAVRTLVLELPVHESQLSSRELGQFAECIQRFRFRADRCGLSDVFLVFSF